MCAPFHCFARTPASGSRPLAMLVMFRPRSSVLGSYLPTGLRIRSPTTPRCCSISSIARGRRGSQQPLPGVYTMEDLLKWAMSGRTEAIGVVTPLHLDDSAPRSSQEFVQIRHTLPPRGGRFLSREEIRSRAIGNFVRGYMAKLFDHVLFYSADHLNDFLKSYDSKYVYSKQNIFNLRVRPPRFQFLPITKESLDFIAHVKRFYPYFIGNQLYALSGTLVEYKRIRLARREIGSLGYRESH